MTMAETIEELNTLFKDLWGAYKQASLKINIHRMKLMLKIQVPPTPLKIRKSLIEIFDDILYLR